MVLGLKAKRRKGSSVQVDYLIHVQEIKPWPPTQSLKSVRSVLLQWENGDQSSGSIGPVVVGNGNIEFNENFRLPLTLSKDGSARHLDSEIYMKNCIEFNLYEPRRDKTVKGQLLGTVVIDLAEYGLVKEPVLVSAPMNYRRSFRSTAHAVMSIRIQPFDKYISGSSSRESLSREASVDQDGKESVSTLMNEEYAEEEEEAEIASFTDDDVSSQSSMTISSSAFEATGSSPPQNEEKPLETTGDYNGRSFGVPDISQEQVAAESEVKSVHLTNKPTNGSSSPTLPITLSSVLESPVKSVPLAQFQERGLMLSTTENSSRSVQSSSSSLANVGTLEEVTSKYKTYSEPVASTLGSIQRIVNGGNDIKEQAPEYIYENNSNNQLGSSQFNKEDDGNGWEQKKNRPDSGLATRGLHDFVKDKEEHAETEKRNTPDESLNEFPPDAIKKPLSSLGDSPVLSRISFRTNGSSPGSPTSNRLRHVKSVRSTLDLGRSNGVVGRNWSTGEVKSLETFEETHGSPLGSTQNEGKNSLFDYKIQEYEYRIEKLEGELREAAAMEVALYSVVAEHASSVNKVHAPARRLSRLFLHASKNFSQVSKASAARSIVSGLFLVAKACGNDVPRLTFWLSNSVVLRGIISLVLRDSEFLVSAQVENNAVVKGSDKRSTTMKWKKSSPGKNGNNLGSAQNLNDWEDPWTIITAIEKIESWIFSRIVESIWWQTLTPYMQLTSGMASAKKMSSSLRGSYERQSSLPTQDQVNFSLELWKKAFEDASERLCPVRASGHECGCLSLLARLVMEQSVARLDVAMFNAILRESDDEMPTDPISDPISDPEVLPIPAGKSSFGAGAQLKTVIGNWSRWLTDLFGLDDDIQHDKNETNTDNREECEKSSKSFDLLHSLSNLLMLPKDMLLNKSIRKEVCPIFDASMIKRILHNFEPDEFCPDPVDEPVFDALDAEASDEDAGEEFIRNFPVRATPLVYRPPKADLLVDMIGEVGKESHLRRTGTSVLRKSQTSDDELDELHSPLNSIIFDSQSSSTPKWSTKENEGQKISRYQLLHEVWKDSY